MKLTESNYYSKQANFMFCSASQFKQFHGTIGMTGCEAAGLAQITGEYVPEMTDAMRIGAYVDHKYEGTLESFKAEHPEIFKQDGTLMKKYEHAEEIYDRCARDELFSLYMSGDKQTIMTSEIAGVPFKIKMDSYHRGKCIVDLKVVQDLHKTFYVKDFGHVGWIETFGYDYQLAIYQKVVENETGLKLPTYIAAVDKGNPPDIEILYLDNEHLKECLAEVERYVPTIQAIKRKEAEPVACENCAYCKSVKKLKSPIHYTELFPEFGNM